MKKIIGIAFIIVLIFGFTSCSSVNTYNSGRYESRNVGEIQYATIDSDFSTAIDTKEKAYKESDVLGLFLNVGAWNLYTEDRVNFNGVKTIVLINSRKDIETKEDVECYNLVQKELEIIAKDINDMSYKFKAVVDNNYPYVTVFTYGNFYERKNFRKELKKGIFPITIRKENRNISTGLYDQVTLDYTGFLDYYGKFNGIFSNYDKNVIRHEIYHCLGLSHYTYSFDEIGSKNGRKLDALPKFSKMNIMSYVDDRNEGKRKYYTSNPDDIKLIELFSTVPNLEKKIVSNTGITIEELTNDNKKYSNVKDVVQKRILDKYNVFIGTKDEKKSFDFGSKKDFYDIETIKEDAGGYIGTNTSPTLTITTLMLSKVGCNVIDKMFADKKPLSEIIDYAEKYYNTELIPVIDIYLEAKMVSFYKTNIRYRERYIPANDTEKGKIILIEESSVNDVLTKDEFDARLKKKYQRELTTSKDIFSSLREMLKSKGGI